MKTNCSSLFELVGFFFFLTVTHFVHPPMCYSSVCRLSDSHFTLALFLSPSVQSCRSNDTQLSYLFISYLLKGEIRSTWFDATDRPPNANTEKPSCDKESATMNPNHNMIHFILPHTGNRPCGMCDIVLSGSELSSSLKEVTGRT